VNTLLNFKNLYVFDVFCYFRWVPYDHVIVRLQVVDGGDGHLIWRVVATTLKKLSQTADEVWSSSFGVGRGANKS
jgi:hypothetical protein